MRPFTHPFDPRDAAARHDAAEWRARRDLAVPSRHAHARRRRCRLGVSRRGQPMGRRAAAEGVVMPPPVRKLPSGRRGAGLPSGAKHSPSTIVKSQRLRYSGGPVRLLHQRRNAQPPPWAGLSVSFENSNGASLAGGDSAPRPWAPWAGRCSPQRRNHRELSRGRRGPVRPFFGERTVRAGGSALSGCGALLLGRLGRLSGRSFFLNERGTP